MLNAGIGEKQISAILAKINLPGLSRTTSKVREWEIWPAIETVAESSCDRAIRDEIKMTAAVEMM